jgi:hypothetical protein
MATILLMTNLLSTPTTAVTSNSSDVLTSAHRYTQLFYDGMLGELWPRLSPALQHAFADVGGFASFRDRVRAEAGHEVERLSEDLIPWLGNTTIYSRVSRFSATASHVLVQWTLDSDGVAQAFVVRPLPSPAPTSRLDYRTKTSLQLPFRGRWFVFWGGRTVVHNHHAVASDQRFAYDFVIARKGDTHAGDGLENSDYYCFGIPVLAPAAGTVVRVHTGVPDNDPGELNERQPAGNYVVLDHGNGEFSFLAHLKRGSIAVSRREHVVAGDVIGACGNSGRSSEPHLHYHLQTTPVLGSGAGLPAQFQAYRADGRVVMNSEPTRGQTVTPVDSVSRTTPIGSLGRASGSARRLSSRFPGGLAA